MGRGKPSIGSDSADAETPPVRPRRGGLAPGRGEEAGAGRLPGVLTDPAPAVSRSGGPLLRSGTRIRDGKLGRRTCTPCTLQGHGLARAVAKLIATLPVSAWH